ncbi:MAG: hypothetical protein A3H93_09065 [Rhodocyclales bacterium RIFCSPLOWO2_02_FULL_63_24]|nr:MAG: hypothetical protein A3H93_09065 [Rhodocyclales bacterium RIFCSPLOWO2_02_FULL_63_24]
MSQVSMYECDFCGARADSNRHMTAGQGNERHICDACVRKALAALRENIAIEGGIENGAKVIAFPARGAHHAA